MNPVLHFALWILGCAAIGVLGAADMAIRQPTPEGLTRKQVFRHYIKHGVPMFAFGGLIIGTDQFLGNQIIFLVFVLGSWFLGMGLSMWAFIKLPKSSFFHMSYAWPLTIMGYVFGLIAVDVQNTLG